MSNNQYILPDEYQTQQCDVSIHFVFFAYNRNYVRTTAVCTGPCAQCKKFCQEAVNKHKAFVYTSPQKTAHDSNRENLSPDRLVAKKNSRFETTTRLSLIIHDSLNFNFKWCWKNVANPLIPKLDLQWTRAEFPRSCTKSAARDDLFAQFGCHSTHDSAHKIKNMKYN